MSQNGPNSNIPYELELTVGPITVNGNGTTLVPATNTTLGGVIIPDNGGLSVDSGGNLTVTGGDFVPTRGANGNSVLSMPGYGLEIIKPTTQDPTLYNDDALNLQTSGIYTSYNQSKDGNNISYPSITFGDQGSISLISKYHNSAQSGLWYNTGLNITPYSVQLYTNAGLDMSNPNAVVYKSYADSRYQANGTTMPYPNYNGTNLEAIPFVGTGLADTSNTACSVAIGSVPDFNGKKIYGTVSNYNNTLQINGLTDIYSSGLLAPSLAAGNAANGTGGIYAVPGDCRLINLTPQTSASVVNKGYVDSKLGSLPYVPNATTNSTYSLFDTATDSRLEWVKDTDANSTGSILYKWLDNTGRYGTLQWILKPNTGLYSWLWGGTSINYNTTNSTRGSITTYVNYSDNYAAGNAYGRGITISPQDVVLSQTVLGAGVLPAKEWTANSILTLSYADTRYVNEPANGTFTGTFTSQDGKTVTVENGLIISVQ